VKTHIIKIRWQPRPRWGSRGLHYTFPFTLIFFSHILLLYYSRILFGWQDCAIFELFGFIYALPTLPLRLCQGFYVPVHLCLGLNKFLIHFKQPNRRELPKKYSMLGLTHRSNQNHPILAPNLWWAFSLHLRLMPSVTKLFHLANDIHLRRLDGRTPSSAHSRKRCSSSDPIRRDFLKDQFPRVF
jgi:hypothetical protein